MSRAVVVLGGNAFAAGSEPLTMAGQLAFAHRVLSELSPLLESDWELLLSHGNGPQVGQMLTRVEEALGKAYALPLEVCVAETEGELGYVLEQALYNVLASQRRRRPIATLLTQVVVDSTDRAFEDPTKPVGVFYDAEQAEALRGQGMVVAQDAGRGFRRRVPSPLPREIVELDVLRELLRLGVLVIAAGGGGIPVVRRDDRLVGVEAVIDKDRTAALLADQLGAELLLIVTDVPCAYTGYRSLGPRPLPWLSPASAQELAAAGEFAPGSMLPKIEAAAQFASQPGRRAIICEPAGVRAALAGRAGTWVSLQPPAGPTDSGGPDG